MATRPQAATVAAIAEAEPHSYVDWCAVFAGTVVAAAISLVLLTFGTAIGLSMVSPYAGEGASKVTWAIALGLWTLWVVISSNLAGGYVAGRMRRRVGDATEAESDVRDGMHGLTVWGLGVLIAALFALVGATGVISGAGKAAGAAASSSASDQARTDPMGTAVDTMFRSDDPARVGDTEAAKKEVARILAQGTAGRPVPDDDKAYVARLVSARTGLSQDEATRRVDDALAKARRAVDVARKTGIITGFLIAAALAAAAAGAWFAAVTGGRHRDQGTGIGNFPWH
ncbi:MAG: hypothetical protein ACM30I_15215 [Gemmatimonas sp.]